MGVAYELKSGIVLFTTTGDIEHYSALDTLKAGLSDAAGCPTAGGWHLLFDVSKSTENRDPNELRNIANAIAERRSSLSGRCAIVAVDPLHYGLSRMFGVFISGLGFEVHVCHDLVAAIQWLNTSERG